MFQTSILSRILMGFAWLLLEMGSAFAQIPNEWDQPAAEIAEAWKVRKEVLSMGQDTLDKKSLQRIEDIQKKYNLTSIPTVSVALLHEMKEVEDEPPPSQKERLAYSAKFSPDIPVTDYFLCRPKNPGFKLAESAPRCVKGLTQDFKENEGLLRWSTNLVQVVLLAFMVLTVLFFGFLVVRHAQTVTHRWMHRFSGLSPIGVSLMSLSLMLLSWLLIGWLGPVLMISLLSWRYINLAERLMVTFLFLGIALFPAALIIPAIHLNYVRSISPILEHPLRDASAIPENASKLQSWLKDHPKDAEANFTLGLIEKEVGRYAQARELLEAALKLRPNWVSPALNLANIDYLEGKIPQAISRLQAVISDAPRSMVAHFNLSKIFYKQSRLDEGIAENRKAKEIDSRRIEQLERISNGALPNSLLVDEMLSKKDVEERIWKLSKEVSDIKESIHRGYFPMLPLPIFWIVLGFVFCLQIALPWIFPIRRRPKTCDKCGAPSCAICDPMVEHESLCSQCFHIFVRLEAIDPDARKQKERQISRFRFLRDFNERWLTIFVPGLHQYFEGNFGRGTLTLLISAATLAVLIPSRILLVSPYSLSIQADFPIGGVALVLFLLTYSLSIWGAVRK